MKPLSLPAMAPAADPTTPADATLAPAQVHRLGHVALRVADMERAKAFYRGLGLEVTWDAPDWSYLQSPLTGDGVALLSPDYTAAGPHAAFHVDDRGALAAIHSQLTDGGHAVGPIHDHRDGTASFYLQDPEGNWLEILYEPPGGIPSNVGAAPIPAPGPALG
jgi:catechol 2,3-dioxygenase-like lactoylglutathione lyase family enzyme